MTPGRPRPPRREGPDEGKMSEGDRKLTRRAAGKETPAAKPTKGKAAKPAATAPTKKKARWGPRLRTVTEAPVRRAKRAAPRREGQEGEASSAPR